jgi:lycopene cyclase domain-containing protein
MKFLYLIIDLATISVPLFYSIYDKKFNFIKHFKSLSFSIILTAVLFIIWDIIFTKLGIWGFNEKYLLGINFINLPIEEVFFFYCIPYASIFTHEVLKYFFPRIGLPRKITTYLSVLLITVTLIIATIHYDSYYTFYSFIVFATSVIIGLKFFKEELSKFLVTYIVVLLPFFLVNGALTGSFTDEPIVWYNNHNLKIRLFTIPVEDVFYGFSMLWMSVMIFQKLKRNE